MLFVVTRFLLEEADFALQNSNNLLLRHEMADNSTNIGSKRAVEHPGPRCKLTGSFVL
jgi:hypothetical protein